MASEQFANFAQTTLSAAITSNGQTSIDVSSDSGFPAVSQFRILIDDELMVVTSVGGGTNWTVARAQDTTSAALHVAGALVTQVLSAAILTDLTNLDALLTGLDAGVLVGRDSLSSGAAEEIDIGIGLIMAGSLGKTLNTSAQEGIVASNFSKTNDAGLGFIPGLTARGLIASKQYRFEARLFVDAGSTGGTKFAIDGSGGLTASPIVYQVDMIDNSAIAYVLSSRQTSLGGSVSNAGATAGFCSIEGTITVGNAGSLGVQFAQSTSNGTSSTVLAGSTFTVTRLS